MNYSPLAIANTFYELHLENEVDYDFTHMKVQKLVYITHGWTLGIRQEPLIADDVMAWKYGPVIERLWHALKEFGHGTINKPIQKFVLKGSKMMSDEPQVPTNDDWSHALIRQIWEVYGPMSAIQLSRLTHQVDTPWHKIAKQFNFELPTGVVIPRELIEEHYVAKWKAANKTNT